MMTNATSVAAVTTGLVMLASVVTPWAIAPDSRGPLYGEPPGGPVYVALDDAPRDATSTTLAWLDQRINDIRLRL